MLKKGVHTIARILLVLSVPAFLLLTNLYIFMTPTFLRYEYGKANFPPSPGFTDEERLMVADRAVTYLRSDTGIELLGDLEGGDGPLFNERELAHMVDVKVVTRQAFLAHGLLGLLIAFSLAILLVIRDTQPRISLSLLQGSLLTIALLLALVALVYLSFDWFFTQFHLAFFEGDSWIFAFSDTLIRLFPTRFWFDAASLWGVFTLGEAVILGVVAWLSGRLTYSRATR
ncbi:MAG: TIGR01906 family membrane protein [Anaerolineales bacterium]|nr:TIGR01906 family membrane protein [Anaerolineales bacterium]